MTNNCSEVIPGTRVVTVQGLPFIVFEPFVHFLEEVNARLDILKAAKIAGSMLNSSSSLSSSSSSSLLSELSASSHVLSAEGFTPIPKSLVFRSQVYNIPHPSKAAKGEAGEDAWFVTNLAVGIADGVGGWRNKRGCDDAGLYSRMLMSNVRELVEEDEPADRTPARGVVWQPQSSLHPQQLLSQAYERMDVEIMGSTTACVVCLQDGTLHGTAIGDSGFLVIRPGVGVLYRSPEQQHYFNCPLQLGPVSFPLFPHSPQLLFCSCFVVLIGFVCLRRHHPIALRMPRQSRSPT